MMKNKRRVTKKTYKGRNSVRAYMTPKELKSKAKTFYVYKDNRGFPIITTMFTINDEMKCFNNFNEAYVYWLNQIEVNCPDTVIVEVDTSTFYVKELQQYSVSYAYRILKGKEVILEKSEIFGTISMENHKIGTYGVAELIGATYALKELDAIPHNNVVIRFDNQYIQNVAWGRRVDISKENARYVAEYVRTYKHVLKKADVSFQHVYSHVGDTAHDNIDKKAKNKNREANEKILAFA